MSGRRPIHGEKMKPNGMTAELDLWYRQEALRRGFGEKGGARLKRLALEKFRQEVEAEQIGKTPLAVGE